MKNYNFIVNLWLSYNCNFPIFFFSLAPRPLGMTLVNHNNFLTIWYDKVFDIYPVYLLPTYCRLSWASQVVLVVYYIHLPIQEI